MSSSKYSSICRTNTTFNQPRQKIWACLHYGSNGWSIVDQDPSFPKIQGVAKELLSNGGMYTSIDRIMVCEIVPIDIVMTPTV